MKTLLHAFVALLLLLMPAFGQDGDYAPDKLAGKSVAALQTMGTTAITALEKADKANDDARAALLKTPDDAALSISADEAKAALEAVLDDARAVANALDDKEADTKEMWEQIAGVSGQVTDMSLGSAAGLISKWTQKAKTYAVDEGPGLIINLVLFLAILFAFKLLAGLGAKLTGKALTASKLKVSDLLKKFFVGTVRKLIFFAGLLIALKQIGVDTGPLLAGIGVVGFVIGFALQDTLSNFASGIMILLYRPYDIGNVITAGGETGKVEDMSLVSTTMLTPDNQKLIVPNSAIWGGVIRNITAQKTRRIDLVVGVGYDADLDHAKKVLMDIVSSQEKVMKDPAPVVEVTNLGESSVDFVVRPWCKTSDYWDIYWDLQKTIKQRLDKEGISIPFPQRDLHLVTVPEKLSV